MMFFMLLKTIENVNRISYDFENMRDEIIKNSDNQKILSALYQCLKTQ